MLFRDGRSFLLNNIFFGFRFFLLLFFFRGCILSIRSSGLLLDTHALFVQRRRESREHAKCLPGAFFRLLGQTGGCLLARLVGLLEYGGLCAMFVNFAGSSHCTVLHANDTVKTGLNYY